MIDIIDKKDCCGCHACEQVCTKRCIAMKLDSEGFHYPTINKDTCIDCGLCEKVCPVLNVEPEVVNTEQEGHLLQLKDDEIRKHSTSGGAFTAISQWVIEHQGTVFGAKMCYDDLDHNVKKGWYVRHTGTNTIEGLEQFRVSKYVQSYVGNCYAQVKKLLKADKWVLFS